MATTMNNAAVMQSVAKELDELTVRVNAQFQALDEAMADLAKLWSGEAAAEYGKAYAQNRANFQAFVASLSSCSTSLQSIAGAYTVASRNASDAVQRLRKGRG